MGTAERSTMGFSFRPEFEGDLAVARVPEDFFERVARRVGDGLWIAGRRNRANYRVSASSRDSVAFAAEDFLTAYSIGLNEVELTRSGPQEIHYRVRFGRWSRYAQIHAGLLGVTMAALSFLPLVREQVATTPYGVPMFWTLVAFWSLAWPWLLTALHRPFAREALVRVLMQELTGAGRSTV